KIYFSSWVLWFGPVPLPGAYATLGAIALCLLAKFLLYSPWRAHQAGIILSHLGVLVLLIGGMGTGAPQRGGFIMLREGQSGSTISDYHARVLRIEKDGAVLRDIPFGDLPPRGAVEAVLPFKVSVDSLCRNCRPAPVKTDEGRHGLAQQITLQAAPTDQS